MAVICPAILAASKEIYHQEMERLGKLVQRIQIDLTDSHFAPTPTVRPEEAWWPAGVKADFHLMYNHPYEAVKTILLHQAHMIIVHAEAEGNFNQVADFCHQVGVKVGVALMPKTPADEILPALPKIDHVLIFSGELGRYGGYADFSLLAKVSQLKAQKPNLEFGWDGGVNDQNVSRLISSGVDILNVGGYIQDAKDPATAFATLQRIADETGTT